jgi:UDP-N-acetyl-D-glucosamine dehydrogenase
LISHDDWSLESVGDVVEGVRDMDCVVIVTNHSNYDYQSILENASLIIDTRNALGDSGRDSSQVIRL